MIKNLHKKFLIKDSFFIGIGLSFGTLAVFAKQKSYFSIDLSITRTIQQINFPLFYWLMRLVTEIGNPLLGSAVAIVTYIILISLKKYKEFAGLFISTTGAVLISNVFKTLVSRTRPDPTLINQIDIYLKPDSFPSGHVLFFVGFFGFLIYLLLHEKKTLFSSVLSLIFAVLIILIGISRIYVGAHWFSDVLGAYLVGVLWLYITVLIFKKF